MAFPFAIGIVCQIAAEQEARAGNFQNILTLPNRAKSIISKLSILLFFGLLSAILCTALFGVFFSLTGSTLAISLEIIILIPTVIWGEQHIDLYFQYLIALRFGGNFCIAVGVAGSLLSALLQTGLGTGIWFIIPYGLGIRFSEFALKKSAKFSSSYRFGNKNRNNILCYSNKCYEWSNYFWFSKYDGNRISD